MKSLNYLFTVILIAIYAPLFGYNYLDNFNGKTDTIVKEFYVGKYQLSDNGDVKFREIILKNGVLYYVVDSKTEIPLKPESETKFNLYPSSTYIYFEFDKNNKVKNLTIKTGNGRIMKGIKKS